MAQPRGICPDCARSIALNDYSELWDHNSIADGGGALFRSKRVLGTYPRGQNPICPGSGKKVARQP
jgi:hypothetical protein